MVHIVLDVFIHLRYSQTPFKLAFSFSCLKVLLTISSLDVDGELIPNAWSIGTDGSVTNCNKFLVFYLIRDIVLIVVACLTNNFLEYRGTHPCMDLKVKSRILYGKLLMPD